MAVSCESDSLVRLSDSIRTRGQMGDCSEREIERMAEERLKLSRSWAGGRGGRGEGGGGGVRPFIF